MVADVQHFGRPAVVGDLLREAVLFGHAVEAARTQHRHAVFVRDAHQLRHHARRLAHDDQANRLAFGAVKLQGRCLCRTVTQEVQRIAP